MRLAALVLWLLAGCTGLPPADTPYFAATASGDNLYPATETRIYATDQRVDIQEPHAYNADRGLTTITQVPGAFAFGLSALDMPPPPTPQPLVGPDACCHVFVQRDYFYFDGSTRIGIPESVWRQAAGIPPFVDESIPAR